MAQQLSSSRVVARNAVFNVGGYAVSALYILVLLPLIVHYLGTEAFGLWSLVLAVTGYAGLADLGLSTSFVKYVAEYAALNRDDEVNSVVRHGILFYLGLSAVFLAAGAALGHLVFPLLNVPAEQIDLAWKALMLALVAFSLNNLSFVFASVLSGLQRLDVFNVFQAAFMTARVAAIALTLALGGGLLEMMAADAAVAALALLPLWLLTRRSFRPLAIRPLRFDPKMFARLVRFGGQLQVSRFAEVVQIHFDKLVISRFLGLSMVGMYEFGSRPLARLRAFPVAAMGGLLPAMSALDSEDNRERILAGVIRSTRYVVLAGLPVFVFVAVFARPIVGVWLGEGFDLAATALQILAAGYFAGIVAVPLAFAAQGRGEPRYQMHSTLAQALLNIVLSIVLVGMFGFAGAAAGTSIAAVFGAALFVRLYAHRLMPRPAAAYGNILAKPLLAAAAAVAAGLAAASLAETFLGGLTRLERAGEVGAGLLAFGAVYALMIIKLRVLGPDDRGFLMNILPSRLLPYVTRERP